MNILVIRLHRLGDILQLTPMLEGIKRHYPGSVTTFLTSDRLADALSGNPFVDRILTIPELQWRCLAKGEFRDRIKAFLAVHRLAAFLREERFDLVINRQYEEGGILAAMADAPQVNGGVFSPQRGHVFDDEPSRELFDAVKSDRRGNRRNLVDWSLRIAGAPPGSGRMCLNIPRANAREADHVLASVGGKLPPIAVQLGAARSFRCWGAGNFAAVIRRLADFHGRSVVLLGSPDERELAEGVLAGCGRLSGRIVDLVGKTSLKTLGAVLQRCEVLISGDTGTAHVAAAVRTPVISLFFGTAYPWETAPYGTGNLVLFADLPCAPCLDPSRCGHGQACRSAVRSEHVCRAWEIRKSLSRGKDQIEGWRDDVVRLLVTWKEEDAEITLNDFNAFDTLDPASLLSSRREKEEKASRLDTSEEEFRFLEEMESRLCEALYLHETPWEEPLAGYLDAWRHVISFGCVKEGSAEAARIILKDLPPLFGTAASALSSGDPVAVGDIVRSGFRPLRQSLQASVAGPSSEN
jgi:heptosyltransferase-2